MISAKFVEHCFMPGQTIEAAIKKINMHDVNSAEIVELIKAYNHLNNNEVPKIGITVKIPVLLRHENVI